MCWTLILLVKSSSVTVQGTMFDRLHKPMTTLSGVTRTLASRRTSFYARHLSCCACASIIGKTMSVTGFHTIKQLLQYACHMGGRVQIQVSGIYIVLGTTEVYNYYCLGRIPLLLVMLLARGRYTPCVE